VQAANGTYSSTDLASLQAEVEQRLDDINRISQQTDFNGVKVLSGGTKLTLQVGARDGETITLNLKEISVETLGLDTFSIAGPYVEGGTVAAVGAGDFQGKDDTGTKVDITAGNVTFTDTAGGTVPTDLSTLVKDDRGNYYIASDTNFDKNTRYYAAEVKITDAEFNPAGTGTVGPTATIKYDSSKELKQATVGSISDVDAALNTVDTFRSDLGAVQNRLESTVANLNNIVNNLSAARSRIEDADYAVEVSNMTRAQILQQAGTAVLAQANQVPQTVLSLLR